MLAALPSYAALRPASRRASASARGSSKKENTRCELVLRKALSATGLRYRLSASDLPGRPDVVFRGARVVVFIDGDFWHGRNLHERVAKLAVGHNAPYWVAKITGNVARDERITASLTADDWLVLRYWETDIHEDVGRIAEEIAAFVRERKTLRG